MTNVLFTSTHPFINLAISKLEIEIKDLVIRIGMLERFLKIYHRNGIRHSLNKQDIQSFILIDKRMDNDIITKLKLQTLYTTFVNAQQHNADILLSSEDYVTLLDIVDQNKDSQW